MTTTNTLLSSACLGLYLYNRHTMAGKPLHFRAAYCFYHSTMFVLGSVLGWAVIARSLNCGPVAKSILALGTSATMLKVSLNTLDHIDTRLGHFLEKFSSVRVRVAAKIFRGCLG